MTSKTFRNLSSALILVLVLGLGTVIFLWQNEIKKLKSEISVLAEKDGTVDKNVQYQAFVGAPTSISVKPVDFNSARNAHIEYRDKWKAANITAFKYHEGFTLDLDSITEFKDKAHLLYFNIGIRPIAKKLDKKGNYIVDISPAADSLSLYVYGIDSKGEYIKNPSDPLVPMVYEYLKPCPHNCPEKSNLDSVITGVRRTPRKK